MGKRTKLIVFLGVVALLIGVSVPVAFYGHRMYVRFGCMNNLVSLMMNWSSLWDYTNCPTSLSSVAGWYGPGVLYCPGVDTERVGTTTEHDAHTDYIYVIGLKPDRETDVALATYVAGNNPIAGANTIHGSSVDWASVSNVPVILCPPINHGRRGGNVLFGDYSIRWIGLSEFDKLIEKLYADTNLTIVVSEALTKRSRGRYKSRP